MWQLQTSVWGRAQNASLKWSIMELWVDIVRKREDSVIEDYIYHTGGMGGKAVDQNNAMPLTLVLQKVSASRFHTLVHRLLVNINLARLTGSFQSSLPVQPLDVSMVWHSVVHGEHSKFIYCHLQASINHKILTCCLTFQTPGLARWLPIKNMQSSQTFRCKIIGLTNKKGDCQPHLIVLEFETRNNRLKS